MTGQRPPGGSDELDEALAEMMADPEFRAAYEEACRRSAARDAAVDAIVMAGAYAAEFLAWVWEGVRGGRLLRTWWAAFVALAALFFLWRLGCWLVSR